MLATVYLFGADVALASWVAILFVRSSYVDLGCYATNLCARWAVERALTRMDTLEAEERERNQQ